MSPEPFPSFWSHFSSVLCFLPSSLGVLLTLASLPDCVSWSLLLDQLFPRPPGLAFKASSHFSRAFKALFLPPPSQTPPLSTGTGPGPSDVYVPGPGWLGSPERGLFRAAWSFGGLVSDSCSNLCLAFKAFGDFFFRYSIILVCFNSWNFPGELDLLLISSILFFTKALARVLKVFSGSGSWEPRSGGSSFFSPSPDFFLAFFSSSVRNVGVSNHLEDPCPGYGLASLLLLCGLVTSGLWSQIRLSPCLLGFHLSSLSWVDTCLPPLVPLGLKTWRSSSLEPPPFWL